MDSRCLALFGAFNNYSAVCETAGIERPLYVQLTSAQFQDISPKNWSRDLPFPNLTLYSFSVLALHIVR